MNSSKNSRRHKQYCKNSRAVGVFLYCSSCFFLNKIRKKYRDCILDTEKGNIVTVIKL